MEQRVKELRRVVRRDKKLQRLLTPRLNKYIPIKPTAKQSAFLVLDCLEAFYGGAASGGKSEALLAGALQYADVPGYAALLLRRTFRELSMPSALMDRAFSWLSKTDAVWSPSKYTWFFPSGASLTFGYLQHERDVFQYDSSEFQFIGFDELTGFTETQYRFLFGRARKKKSLKVPVRIRAASNPGGVGHLWVKDRFIKNTKAIAESGRVFIPAYKEDNPYVDQDAYDRALNEMDEVTRRQRKYGDWDAEYSGAMFKRHWFTNISDIGPNKEEGVVSCRFWDLAGTEGGGDFTVGTLVTKASNKTIYIEDVIRQQLGPDGVRKLVTSVAAQDGFDTKIRIEQEPGSAGKHVVESFQRELIAQGYDCVGIPSTGKKEVRLIPFAAECQAGNVVLLSRPWNSEWIDEICAFPNSKHDDQADSAGGGYLTVASEDIWDDSQYAITSVR